MAASGGIWAKGVFVSQGNVALVSGMLKKPVATTHNYIRLFKSAQGVQSLLNNAGALPSKAAQRAIGSAVNPAGRISTSSQPLPTGGAGRVSSQQVTQPAAPPKPSPRQIAEQAITAASGRLTSSRGYNYNVDPGMNASANTVKNRLSADLKAQGWTVKAAAWNAKHGQYRFKATDPDGDEHTFIVNNPSRMAGQPAPSSTKAKAAAQPAAKPAGPQPSIAQTYPTAKARAAAFPHLNDNDTPASAATFENNPAWQKWVSQIAGPQRRSVEWYDDYGVQINDPLRSGGSLSSTLKAHQKNIDAAIANSPGLQSNMTLYRGIRSHDLFTGAGTKYQVGGTFSDGGYASVSTFRSTAADYSGSQNTAVMFKIRAPKGTKVAAIPAYGVHYAGELIMPRNQKFRILAITDEAISGSYGRAGQYKVYELEPIE